MNIDFTSSCMPWQLLIFINRQVDILSVYVTLFNSPSSLVSGNYDGLRCLPTCLFYHQKGIVL